MNQTLKYSVKNEVTYRRTAIQNREKTNGATSGKATPNPSKTNGPRRRQTESVEEGTQTETQHVTEQIDSATMQAFLHIAQQLTKAVHCLPSAVLATTQSAKSRHEAVITLQQLTELFHSSHRTTTDRQTKKTATKQNPPATREQRPHRSTSYNHSPPNYTSYHYTW